MEEDKLSESGMHNGASPSVFRNAAKLREVMTPAEVKLWEYLKNKPKGIKFRRQHPIGGYVLDFYCHKLRFSIELDGGYHFEKEQIEKDKLRTQYINSLGIKEIRFMNKQVINEFDEVIKEITDFINRDC